jgi:hypothetical protein
MFFSDQRKRLLEDIVREIEAAGLRIVEARFDKQALGSLYIEVEGHIALAWDARDHVASIGNILPGVNRLLWSSQPTWDAHLLASRLVDLAKTSSA